MPSCAEQLGRASRAAAILFGISGSFATAQAPGASALPPSAPTSAASPSQLPSANPPIPGSSQAVHSSVSWDGSTLQVIATNASLNQLLQEIAAKTNLQITGTAPEERIFGTYGPGRLDDVLSDLLDGMSVNMLFIDRPGTQSKQLTLTVRSGGTFPSPQTAQVNYGVTRNPTPPDDLSRNPPPQYTAPNAPVDSPPVASDAPAGTRTPQQIFEQLQRLRQQASGQK